MPHYAREQLLPRPLPRRRGPRPSGLPLLIFAGVAVVAIAYITYVLWPRWPGAAVGPSVPALPVTVGQVTFNVPPAAIRAPIQRRPGTYERLDLSFRWPSLEPPDANTKAALPGPDALPTPSAILERVFVTISAGGSSVPPTERVFTIYPRYTNPETSPGPAGLTMLAFRDGTPYQGEDLLYDASAPSFLVRCTRSLGVMPALVFMSTGSKERSS